MAGHSARLVHVVGDYVEFEFAGVALFRYVYVPRVDAWETPKPYFHPVRTLTGEVVTNFRPHDHVWHHGLTMTVCDINGENFWGGKTYDRDTGRYVLLDNNGRQAHDAWLGLELEGDLAVLTERVRWLTHTGRCLISEERRVRVLAINAAEGFWTLQLEMRLVNVSGEPLVLGSPTAQGRPGAGYGSLFWRGPRSFEGGTILADGDLAGPEVMGKSAAWLAFTGRHDGTASASTLVFADDASNPCYPTQWFVRTRPYPGVSFAFVFDHQFTLAAGAELPLQYRITFAQGAWPRARIAQHVQTTPAPD